MSGPMGGPSNGQSSHFDEKSENLGVKLAKKLNSQCFVSWNVSEVVDHVPIESAIFKILKNF